MDVLLTKFKWQFALGLFRWYSSCLCVCQTNLLIRLDKYWTFRRRWHDTEPEECESFSSQIDYLGHVVPSGLLEVSIRTIDIISRLEYPATVKVLLSSLGLCNVFHRFFLKLYIYCCHPAEQEATSWSATSLCWIHRRWKYLLRAGKGEIDRTIYAGSFT